MLGVSREATKAEIQGAFFALAKVWHPDRLPPALAEVRDSCSTVFAHLSEAHQTLTDTDRRQKYVHLMQQGGATPADQQQALIALGRMTNAIHTCLSPLARKNPKLLGAQIRVGAATMGDGTPTRLTILPTGTSDDVKTCVTNAIAPVLIGDTANAQLLFDVRIDKTPK